MRHQRIISLGRFLLIALLFGISYTQNPLYTSNQNTYFLHGLADGGLGFLDQDWMAQTVDPFPVFSLLVSFTFGGLHESMFYLYYLAILGIYICGMIGIVSWTCKTDDYGTEYFTYVIILTGLHSAAFGRLSSQTLGINLRSLVHSGLAGQYVLGPVFQPSTFGVFLVLSIYFHLRDKSLVGVLFSSIAAILHSTYLLSAATLTIMYMINDIMEEKNVRRTLFLGVFSFSLVLPILCYDYFYFAGGSSEVVAQAQSILVDYRIPHHAKVGYWFSKGDFSQVLLILIALYIVRKRKRLFIILLGTFVIGVGLTFVEIITGNRTLALLFPWRLSVFLVPISSCLITGSIISAIFSKFKSWFSKNTKWVNLILTLSACLLFLSGIIITRHKFKAHLADRHTAQMMDFVVATREADITYLVPANLSTFRLYTGAPILVDRKTHPYKYTEVIEWYNRLQISNRFYRENSRIACGILQDILDRYEITHVVFRSNATKRCGCLGQIYQDDRFTIYQILEGDCVSR